MKKALVVKGRVHQIEDTPFPIAETEDFKWVDCPVDTEVNATFDGTSFTPPVYEVFTAMDLWVIEMEKSDYDMSRVEEDIIGVLSPEQFAKLPTVTRSKYTNKVAKRLERPQ